MHTLGSHFLLELSGCSYRKLNDQTFVEKVLVGAAKAAKTTVVNSAFHTFSPFGVSGVVVIAESHLSIHTWPEYGYAAIDVFTCGDEAIPRKSLEYCVEQFQPTNHTVVEITRGIMDDKRKKASCFLSFKEGGRGHT